MISNDCGQILLLQHARQAMKAEAKRS